MQWTASAIADLVSGVVVAGDPATVLDGATIDSRATAPGALFFALRAERDGHRFVADALAAGAGGYLVEAGGLDRAGVAAPEAGVGIEVADTARALADLGRAARRQLSGPVVGITGSVGKTSTKDLAAAAVAAGRRVTANAGSFNNELGVPLTLVNAAAATDVTVVEMGARGIGHIRSLCDIAAPTVGVVTAVAAAHTEMFGSVEAIATAKGELIEALPADGHALLNADDPRVAAMARRSAAPVIRWSTAGAPAEITAEDVTIDDQLRPRFTVRSGWGRATVVLQARGLHQVANALAALAVALVCGVDLDAAVGGLAVAPISRWRMEVRHGPGGVLVINDAYNANPTSMEAALRSLARLPARRRVAVVGAMAELGPSEDEDHRAVAALASGLGVELVAVGTDLYGTTPMADVAAAAAYLGDLDGKTAVLVKGSRVAGLERLADLLAPPPLS